MFDAAIGMSVFSFLEAIGTLQIILFIIGLLLMLVEAFTPGFGLAGGAGLILIIVGIFMTAREPLDFLIMFLILLVVVAVLLFIVLRSAKKGRLKKLVLHSASTQDAGYSATDDYNSLVGQDGVALTVLRPAGSGEIAGQRFDVVTDGEYIEKGARIKVVRVEGRRIVVEQID